MNKKITKGTLTQTQIYIAAAKITSRNGIASLTFRSIAKETGLTLGGVQFHVNKIDSLFYETVLFIYQELGQEDREAGATLMGLEYLLYLAKFNFSIFENHPHYYAAILQSYQLAKTNKKFKSLYQDFLDRSTRRIFEKVNGDYPTQDPEGLKRSHLFAWECMLLLEGSLLFTHISGKSQLKSLVEKLTANFDNFISQSRSRRSQN